MIIRDARGADLPVVRRLIGQLTDAPDEMEFRARFERVSAEAGHRLIVAEMEGEVVGVLHVFERPALEKPCEAIVQALVVDGALYPHRPRWGAAVLRAHRLSPEGDIAPDGSSLGAALALC